MPPKHIGSLLMTCLLIMPLLALGQQVYRCEINGKIGYSHEPCVGAKAIDTTPTQGMDKMTGQSKKGADVRKAEHNRQFAEAIKPLTGKTPEEMEVATRRQKLSPLEKHNCTLLDSALPQLHLNATRANTEEKDKAEGQLYKARKAFRDLRC